MAAKRQCDETQDELEEAQVAWGNCGNKHEPPLWLTAQSTLSLWSPNASSIQALSPKSENINKLTSP